MSCAFGACASGSVARASPGQCRASRQPTRSNAHAQHTCGSSHQGVGPRRGSRGASGRGVGIARTVGPSPHRRNAHSSKLHSASGHGDFQSDWDDGSEGLDTQTTAKRDGSPEKTSSSGANVVDRKNGKDQSSPKSNVIPKPPERDTGIKREKDMGIDFEAAERNDVDADGNSYFLKSGVDTGDDGYKCRWTVQGRTGKDGTWEHRETHWEKSDFGGYKELGAELSGFNEEGDTWWETWREVYKPSGYDEGDGVEDDNNDEASQSSKDSSRIERGADKWARDKTGKEWHEKWWENFEQNGSSERSVEKSGRQGIQAWWEKWGEQRDAPNSQNAETIKWTDKWAENGVGTRWGDKWEERFFRNSKKGSKKVGETWRVGAGGERWSRTWGETVGENGEVRKYGKSTSGERWDTVEEKGKKENSESDSSEKELPFEDQYGWSEALADSERLLAIRIDDGK